MPAKQPGLGDNRGYRQLCSLGPVVSNRDKRLAVAVVMSLVGGLLMALDLYDWLRRPISSSTTSQP